MQYIILGLLLQFSYLVFFFVVVQNDLEVSYLVFFFVVVQNDLEVPESLSSTNRFCLHFVFFCCVFCSYLIIDCRLCLTYFFV